MCHVRLYFWYLVLMLDKLESALIDILGSLWRLHLSNKTEIGFNFYLFEHLVEHNCLLFVHIKSQWDLKVKFWVETKRTSMNLHKLFRFKKRWSSLSVDFLNIKIRLACNKWQNLFHIQTNKFCNYHFCFIFLCYEKSVLKMNIWNIKVDFCTFSVNIFYLYYSKIKTRKSKCKRKIFT